jgi:hypothetical protein
LSAVAGAREEVVVGGCATAIEEERTFVLTEAITPLLSRPRLDRASSSLAHPAPPQCSPS